MFCITSSCAIHSFTINTARSNAFKKRSKASLSLMFEKMFCFIITLQIGDYIANISLWSQIEGKVPSLYFGIMQLFRQSGPIVLIGELCVRLSLY